jgi:hypothetical protein
MDNITQNGLIKLRVHQKPIRSSSFFDRPFVYWSMNIMLKTHHITPLAKQVFENSKKPITTNKGKKKL